MPAALLLPSTLVHGWLSITIICIVCVLSCFFDPCRLWKFKKTHLELKQLTQDVAETKDLCRSLLKRQAEFEQLMLSEFQKMQTYIQGMVFIPASNRDNFVSTPKAVRLDQQEVFQLPEQPVFTPSHLSTTPAAQELPETTQPLNDETNTSLICPTRVSLLRANSCSRENGSQF